MKILSKNGDEIILLAVTSDSVNKGDYFVVEDFNVNKKLLVQIYEEEYSGLLSNKGRIGRAWSRTGSEKCNERFETGTN